MKKEKKKGITIFRWAVFLVLLLIIVLVVVIKEKTYPYHQEIQQEVYDALVNMDETTFKRAGNTEIYDSNNEIIGRIGNEKYKYVSIDEIPEWITKGYVSVEDKNFYTHKGIDYKALLRAGISYVKNKGHITQGGSTITQQVVKNNLLSQEQTFTRKFTEIPVALELEKKYNKAQIMEFYCNSNYYGNGCYGVSGAAKYYFGKDLDELTLAECAILVGTSNSPNKYNPVADYDLCMLKKDLVLKDMLDNNVITQEEYDEASEERPEIVKYSENTKNETYMMSYAIHCATIKLMEDDNFKFKYNFSSQKDYDEYKEKYDAKYKETANMIRNGGYTIYTSLDKSIQKQLQKSVDKTLIDFKDKSENGMYEMQGAAVCIDSKTKMVVAAVGGRNEEGEFNRAFQSTRSPGSSIKPLLDYGPALNEGAVIPATVIKDEKIDYNGYSPKNAGGRYRGNVTVREALARSINTIAVKLMYETGNDICMKYLSDMKFSSLDYPDFTMLSSAIGGFTNGVTVSDMARGYATLANNGKFSDNTCIVSIKNNITDKEYVYETTETQVYSEDTAFILKDMMQGVFKESYGTAHGSDTDDQIYAGKTGTTNDNKDAWFCGFSQYYTTAVWVGKDTPEPVDGLSGNTYPLTIWSDFMNTIHAGLSKKGFDLPSSVILSDQKGNELIPSGSLYENRPSGYDYISGSLKDKIKERELAEKDIELIAEAEKKVIKFEDYVISSTAEAKNLQMEYISVTECINLINDTEKRTELLERAAAKYNSLNSEVMEKWQEVIDKEPEIEAQQKEISNDKEARTSLENAITKLEKADREYKESLIESVEWYIEHLKQRTVYSDKVMEMIADSRDALSKCEDLDEYDQLKMDLENAISYAQKLPVYVEKPPVTMPDETDYE